MDTVFVKLNVDLKCVWEGLPPDYRVYVDNEMFTERTYRWEDPFYLTEILQIEAESNTEYQVRLEPIGPQLAKFTFVDLSVSYCDSKVEFSDLEPRRFKFKVL